MIENITSTKEEPTKFFKWLMVEGHLELYRNTFFRSFENHCDVVYENDDTVSFEYDCPDNNDNPIAATQRVYFSVEFRGKLLEERKKAIKNIDVLIPSLRINNGNIEGYLLGLLKELHHIKNHQSISHRKYICFDSIVSSLIQDITVRINIEKEELPTLDPQITEDIVSEIFSFFNGKNEHGQQIMSQTDYDRMVSAIREMLESESAPQLTPPIPNLNLTVDLLKFAFYVLHKKLYGIKPQRRYFIDFLKNNFKQFDNTQWNTLKSRFSIPPQYFDQSTPSIIRNEGKST